MQPLRTLQEPSLFTNILAFKAAAAAAAAAACAARREAMMLSFNGSPSPSCKKLF